jgi:signal transduction histidine kinase
MIQWPKVLPEFRCNWSLRRRKWLQWRAASWVIFDAPMRQRNLAWPKPADPSEILRSSALRESGFVTALQRLVEHSNLPGRLHCDFRSDRIPEESLSSTVQHQLLRIAQEAISNAVRHAKPTVVSVTLRWDSSDLILQVKDNGSGITKHRLEQSEGVGLESMRERAAQIDAKLEIQTAAGQGTSIIVTVPVSS